MFKSGFTLIELLIVIAIIGIMATVSVGSYNRIRNSTELSIQTDEIISELRKVQSKSKNSGQNKCFGMQFNMTKENSGIYYIEAEYKNPISKCAVEETVNNYYEKNLKISKISLNDSSRVPDTISILFYPPKGEVFIPAFPSREISLELSYKDKQNNQEIVINQINGTIQKKTKTEQASSN